MRLVSCMEESIRYALRPKVLKRSLTIALVVGCTLSFLNQMDFIFKGHFTARLALKLAANFLVPFLVSSVSAAINRS